jgi:hypothetical protein
MQETGNNFTSARLTIRISHHRMSFSVIDRSIPRQVQYQPYTVKSGISMAANLREAFKDDSLLTAGFSKVLISIDSLVLMIPIEEFQKEAMADLYHHAFLNMDNVEILYMVLPELNAVAVFSINKDLKLVIEDHFQDIRYIPTCQPVWKYLQERSYTGIFNKLYGYFHDEKLEIISYDKNRFRFINSFKVKYTKDAIYFLLYVWKQLGYDAHKDELFLSGDMQERKDIVDELRKYLQKVFAINPAAEFNRAPVTQIKMPFDLLTHYIRK